jgi:hypothetical protein
MIYVNNEKAQLPQALISALRKELEGGVQLKYPKKYRSESKTDKGKNIIEWPAARVVRYVDSVNLDLDTMLPANKNSARAQQVQVRWAIGTSFNSQTKQDEYKPIALDKLKTLHPEDYEEFWFLKYCSRFVEGGHNAKANNSKNYSIILYNPEAEAIEEESKKRNYYRVNALIYNSDKEGGLSEPQLRDIAAAFNVGKAMEMSLPALRLKLESAVSQDQAKGAVSGDAGLKGEKYFLHLIDQKVDLTLKTTIRRAIDLGVVKYDTARSAWFYLSEKEGGKQVLTERIVNCEKNVANKENVLFNHFERKAEEKADFLKRVSAGSKEEVDSKLEVDTLKMEAEAAKAEGDVKKYYDIWEKIVALAPTQKHQRELAKAEGLLNEV